MRKHSFTVTRRQMLAHPELFMQALIKNCLEERKGWPKFEVVISDHEAVLYRGTLNACSQIEASDIALALAKEYFPDDWTGIHANPIGVQ